MNSLDISYHVLDIIKGTTVDGPGFRTSIYLAGCPHKCRGCHNPQSWDPEGGETLTLSQIMEIVEEEDFNVTLTGGDPLADPAKLKILVESLKENRRNVWIYTGFIWDEIITSKNLLEAVMMADVVVDGRYEEKLRTVDLPFRGSANQRIIDIQKSLAENKVVLYRP